MRLIEVRANEKVKGKKEWVCHFSWGEQEVFMEKGKVEQRPRGDEGNNASEMQKKSDRCKGPEAGGFLVSSRNIQEVSVITAESLRERVLGARGVAGPAHTGP